MRRIHYYSGLLITVFVTLHLANHVSSIYGAETHITLMNRLRSFYRQPVAEALLVTAVCVQFVSGWRLFKDTRHTALTFYSKLQRWTGIYLAVFLLIHLSAVLIGRLILHLNTNFYFGVAGLNTFPFSLFFVPYYGLAILAFFGHISAIHRHKMTRRVAGLSPMNQANGILLFGCVVTIFIFYGLTNGFRGVTIPADYGVLIGK
jgi:hypothetical protein